ncbi:MAG TPA: chemotaxis protein CheD [Spirochaetota bacterium]|nr:chemotaxis protein CheD [Spirochaetota bacterium]HRX48759.1 chemotaxis protein CheD [Spirochaetota bacterium]
MKRINIHIGEYYSSSEPAVITTILGPCVAVCLYEQTSRIGGMNHILLPGGRTDGSNSGDARYAINAMELLINQMMKSGADRYRLKAKVFGGAQIYPFLKQEMAMGLKNIEMVIDFLITERIPIINYNFGGSNPRKIYFYTGTGDVLMQKIKTSEVMEEFENLKLKRIEIEKRIRKTGSCMFFD